MEFNVFEFVNWLVGYEKESMVVIAILCIAIVIGHKVLPIVHVINKTPREYGRNAKNGPFDIWICRGIPGQSWIGVFAQEMFEFGYKWRRFMLPIFSGSWKRKSEMRGHLIECLVAQEFDGMDFNKYLDTEVSVMLEGYSGMFRSYTAESLRSEMLKLKEECTDWIHSHRGVLDEWHDKWKSNNL